MVLQLLESITFMTQPNLSNMPNEQILKTNSSFRDLSYEHLENKRKIQNTYRQKTQDQTNANKNSKTAKKITTTELDDFYNKSIHWRIEKNLQNQKTQRLLQEAELKQCTFIPKTTPKKINQSKPEKMVKDTDFVSFSNNIKKEINEVKNVYTERYIKKEYLRKNSPNRDQKSYRKVVDVKLQNGEVCDRLFRKTGPVAKEKYEQKRFQLRSFLYDMDF